MADLTYAELKRKYPLAYNELIRLNEANKYVQPHPSRTIYSSTSWSRSPQGSTFWSYLSEGGANRITWCKNKHPELFIMPEVNDTYKADVVQHYRAGTVKYVEHNSSVALRILNLQ